MTENKRLKINDHYIKIFDEWNTIDAQLGIGKIGIYETDYAINITDYQICDISKFRKILHTIIDILKQEDDFYFKNAEQIHKEISSNNFTFLIMLGILDVEVGNEYI